MKNVVTRFAPSPTGNLHIGGARTALYAYLWARKHNGKFILRIEDTDQSRYKEDAEESIFEGLRWLSMEWDGDVIYQSSRTDIYREHAQMLIDAGKAYNCFCSPERLETMRQLQRKKNRAPKYDKTCAKLSAEEVADKISAGESHVVRLNIPQEGSVTVNDLVRGDITFNNSELDDQVLLKSDGFPTYHLANVVDDHDSEVTYVIRGEEWIPSTPKHIVLYKAFGWEPPKFAHLSLFINKGGGKLSKREGAASLLEYRDQGYLPEAVINFIAFLGWNPKTEEEFFTTEELIKVFELTNINTANPIFDTEKLDWYNGHYIRNMSVEDLLAACKPYLPDDQSTEYLTKIVALEQERLKRFSDIEEGTKFFFSETLEYSTEDLIWKKNSAEDTKNYLQLVHDELEKIEDWTAEHMNTIIITWIKDQPFGNGDVLWPLRYSLTGTKASPSPFEVASVLGKEATLQRIKKAISLL